MRSNEKASFGNHLGMLLHQLTSTNAQTPIIAMNNEHVCISRWALRTSTIFNMQGIALKNKQGIYNPIGNIMETNMCVTTDELLGDPQFTKCKESKWKMGMDVWTDKLFIPSQSSKLQVMAMTNAHVCLNWWAFKTSVILQMQRIAIKTIMDASTDAHPKPPQSSKCKESHENECVCQLTNSQNVHNHPKCMES